VERQEEQGAAQQRQSENQNHHLLLIEEEKDQQMGDKSVSLDNQNQVDDRKKRDEADPLQD